MAQQTSELVIFVTHVESDDIYLKIWGQTDKQAATTIEHYIYPLIEQFNQGYGCPSNNRLVIGTLCCARFQTEGYYRAKILNVRPDGMIVVQFIDYGNVEVVLPTDIHLLDNIRGSELLRAFPPMASEFILLNISPINGVWEARTVEAIRKILCYNEYRVMLQMMNNRCLIKLWYNNEDFATLLVKQHMAIPSTLQDMFRSKHIVQPRVHQQMQYQQQNKCNMNNFAAMPMMQNPNMNHNANMQGLYHKTFSPDVNQHKHAQPILQHPPQPPLPIQEALVFKSRVLDVGSSYEVFISHVEDGPQKFSVQIESMKPTLTRLMNEINNHSRLPLQEPPLPGSVCLGCYKDATGDKVLCRAVVMSVMEHRCKLYYVDFGHTEILPYTDIFQLPPEYINPKVLSIRFTLSGLKELNITQEMKEYFKDLVFRKLLILHVRPPEGPPLIQYGDLYENGINVKDMLKKMFPRPATPPITPLTYSYPQLQRLSKNVQEVVYVSYVESYKKFFVQLDSGIKSLESIMAGLTQYAKTASTLNIAQLKTGLPCAALYDSQWYRAQILGVIGDKVKVVYVDYGNEEILPVTSLRNIHDDLITKLPAQAIQCALNGYEVLSIDQEVSNHFEKLTLEKRFLMKVVAAQSNGLLVDLFEFDTMRSVRPLLLNNLFCDKTESSTISSRNEETQHCTKPTNEYQSENKEKYNRKNNTNSWNRNQNDRSSQDKSNWRNEYSEKQYDNRQERFGTYSRRDNSQNDRFVKDKAVNNKSDRDKSYNKYNEGDANLYNKSNRETSRDNESKFIGNERKYSRNNSDKTNSDKDSDTSSRSNDKRGKGAFRRTGFNDNRGESRDSKGSGRFQTMNWNDKKLNKANYRNDKFNDDYDSGNKFRGKENNTSNVNQIIESESCNTVNTSKEQQDIVGKKPSQLSLKKIDIIFNSAKNCEMVFINSPLDFFIQLSPDCLELDSIMESIAATYENGGETIQASEIQSGIYCIAQYSEDLKWYRAMIKSVEGNSATVEFIDYGNTELIELTNIKVISEEFLRLPMQAIRCKLFGFPSTDFTADQHTIFLEKTEGKPLQVEFVCEESEVYEVLLREIVDDVPSPNYINEQFCKIADLTKTTQVATNNKTPKTMTENKTVLVYASPDAKWQTILYEPESKQDVVVSWFINPNKLYCQLLSKETEFKAMMSEIQEIYTNMKPFVGYKLQIGSAVIAIFSEDKAFYRAEVVSIETQKNAYVVQYIDFGNCATVSRYNIYPVVKKFMQLPKLAVQCSLKDIIPNNDKLVWSEVDNNALDNCFNADKYECIFHSFNDNYYIITLNHNGQDVGNTLVQQNLATIAVKPSIEVINTTETSAPKVKEFSNVERVDISLLSGQTLKMRISNVENAMKFYVQLPSASNCENIVDQHMANKNIKEMPRLSTRELCLGAGCLVNANGKWKRAVVINCTRSIGFEVKLIDIGTYDEVLDDALALPGELAVMQNQALECSLQDMSSDADKQLKELVNEEVLVHVKEVDNNRLIVKLYNLLGNGIINTEEKISPICPMPILSSTHQVSVSHADRSTNIWLQRHSDTEIETKLLEDLQQYYTNSGQKLEPKVNLLCAAKYSEDNQWYRGKIIKLTETMAYVNYIDYGNTEEVTLDSLMILESRFYEPHQLAINVSLSISFTGTEDEQKDILQTHLMNKDLTAVFYNVHQNWIVDLIENEEKLSDRFQSLNLLKVEQTAIPEAEPILQDEMAVKSDRFGVCVSHVDSPSQFWLQRMDKIASLNEKQDQLQLEVANFVPIDGIPEEGTLCVTIYSFDDLWYRAEVLDADEDITTVRFIDYGNTDVINNETNSIRQMPDAWKNLESFAFKCRLDVIPVDTEDWSEIICERFKDLVTSASNLQTLIIADTTPKRVELFIDNKSVSEILVEEKHAIIINTEQEPVDEIVDLELDPRSAFVSHINSPSEFWVQEEKSVADLEVMADRFIVADMFPKIDDIKDGLLCVAKYPDDEQWYRACIISHDDNGTEVIYIDYGNSAISTEIRAIPEDLASIPPLSRKCCLELPSQVEEWSEQAHEEFIKLAADGATIFLLDVLKEQETSLVKLTLNGQNVADILGGMCERKLPVIEERLPPLGEENSPNVVVSHINSPDEFWIQAESSISELEVMSDRLRDAESFLTLNNLDVGTICAARYPEDGCWYRAKIIAHCKEGTEVLYIDYGNSAITEELRVLPEDIVNISILSKRCALEKPNNIITWSKEACNKFKELAAEGATMFQFETLDENDPMRVRLSLNGTNVIDLLSECENILKVGEEMKNVSDIEKQETASSTIQEKNDEISYLNKEVQQKLKINQTDNLDQIKELEIDKEVCNGVINSDVNEKCKNSKDQNGSIIKEDIQIVPLELNKNINAAETDNNIFINETVFCANTSHVTSCIQSSSSMELSVEEIIKNMLTDAVDNSESQKTDNTNLLHIVERPKLLSQTQSVEINKCSNIEILESTESNEDLQSKIVSSATTESQSQDVVQTDISRIREEEVYTKTETEVSKFSKSEVLEMELLLLKKQINVEQNKDPALIIPEDNNKDSLETKTENTEMNNDSSSATCLTTSTPKTDPIERCSHSKEQTDTFERDSEDGLSKPETKLSARSKIPHLEKIIAAVVNPYVQSVLDSSNENDEVFLSSTEDKHS